MGWSWRRILKILLFHTYSRDFLSMLLGEKRLSRSLPPEDAFLLWRCYFRKSFPYQIHEMPCVCRMPMHARQTEPPFGTAIFPLCYRFLNGLTRIQWQFIELVLMYFSEQKAKGNVVFMIMVWYNWWAFSLGCATKWLVISHPIGLPRESPHLPSAFLHVIQFIQSWWRFLEGV